jgi:HlyD family secretion protein
MQVRRSPVNVQNVITYTVEIEVNNPDGKLFPGMTANVRLVTDRLSAAIKIPSAALRFRPPDDLMPADAKNTDKKKNDAKVDPGKSDSNQAKGGDGKFDPSQFKGRGGGGGGGFGRNGGGGGGGGGGRNGGGNPGGAARPNQFQTVYTLDEKGQLKAERIRTGISDGNFVAMAGGNLKEGDVLITGIEGMRAGQNQNKNAPGFPGQNNNNQFKNNRGGLPF